MPVAGEIVHQTLVSVSPYFRVPASRSVIDDWLVESVLSEAHV
jgi:hypothetical protein